MNNDDFVVKKIYLVSRERGELVEEDWLGNVISIDGEQHFLSAEEMESQALRLKKGDPGFPPKKMADR